MNDLTLMEPTLVGEEQCDDEIVDVDEDAAPQETSKKRTCGVRVVGHVGIPTAVKNTNDVCPDDVPPPPTAAETAAGPKQGGSTGTNQNNNSTPSTALQKKKKCD